MFYYIFSQHSLVLYLQYFFILWSFLFSLIFFYLFYSFINAVSSCFMKFPVFWRFYDCYNRYISYSLSSSETSKCSISTLRIISKGLFWICRTLWDLEANTCLESHLYYFIPLWTLTTYITSQCFNFLNNNLVASK